MARTATMLTTFDNPYDPFDQFDQWLVWDEKAGYLTSGLLARVAVLSFEMSESDQQQAVEVAIDEVLNQDLLGVYKKVTRVVDD